MDTKWWMSGVKALVITLLFENQSRKQNIQTNKNILSTGILIDL